MRRLVFAAILILTACGVPPTAARPGASATESAPPSVSAPPSSPSSHPTAAPNSEELNGDLPAIDAIADASGDIQQAGGVVHFPGGAFHADAGAQMSQDPKTHLWRTAVQPYLFGSADSPRGRITYDRAVGRWLPVGRYQVSADGLSYAYAQAVYPDSASPPPGPGPFPTGVLVHVVDGRSGSDRVVFKSVVPPFYYDVVSFSEQGIYLSPMCTEGCGAEARKLWRLDVATGTVAKVSDRRGFAWLIRNQIAWVSTYEQYSQPSQLLRVDLTSGQEAIWLTDTALAGLMGLDGEGVPMVALNDVGGSTVVRVTAPQQSETIFSGPTNGGPTAAVADGARTWLGGAQLGSGAGIYLYTRAAGVRKASDFPGFPLGPLH